MSLPWEVCLAYVAVWGVCWLQARAVVNQFKEPV